MKTLVKNFFLFSVFAVQACQCVPVVESPFIVGGIPADVRDFQHKLALFDMIRGGKFYF